MTARRTRMPEIRGLLVAHGELAAALVDAAERIAGVEDALVPISNIGCSPETLVSRISQARGEGPTVIFVDMASGSCTFASLSAARRSPEIAVVTGVNLPMLLDFIFHREMDLAPLVERLVAKGRAAATAHLNLDVLNAHRSVQD